MRYMQPYELFRVLRDRGGRLLGVDIGHDSLAFAVSDSGYKLAYPLCVLPKDPTLTKSPYLIRKFTSSIREIMADNDADTLLFGYPYLKWTANPLAFHIRNTIDALNVPGLLDDVNFAQWDETYTTKIVEKLMDPISMRPEHDKSFKDMLAAAGILQGYLDSMNRYVRIEEEGTIKR